MKYFVESIRQNYIFCDIDFMLVCVVNTIHLYITCDTQPFIINNNHFNIWAMRDGEL